jgi:putative hydrolase of HD superfamily
MAAHDTLSRVAAFLMDAERLKLVERRAYVSSCARRENSAEHSWHLTLGLLTIAREFNVDIDLSRALMMAIIHDLCEIDAGDTPAYGPMRSDQHEAEARCVERLRSYGLAFSHELYDLWLEFEAQETRESRWVKVLDRVMPFVVNLACEGKNWQDQSVSCSQVLKISEPVRLHAPEIFEWMVKVANESVEKGWLRAG